MESDFSLQEDKIHGQKQIPTIDRLRNVQKRIESVDKVLDDVKKLQIKGQVLQKMSKTEKANNDEQTLETKAEHSDSIEDSKAHTKLDVEELVEIDRGLQYVKWLQVVQDISNKVTEVLIAEDKIVNSSAKEVGILDSKDWMHRFSTIVNCHKLLVVVTSSLLDSSCKNLRNYAISVLVYIRRRFLSYWQELLIKQMDSLQYPLCILPPSHQDVDDHGMSRTTGSMSDDIVVISNFKFLYRILVDMRIDNEKIVNRLPQELRDCDPSNILLDPLKKRFKYHFMGSRKTNNPLKPEWYLQQVWIWIQRSKSFFDTCITPAQRSDENSFPGHTNFCSGLLTLTQKKLENDMPLVIEDDMHFSHLIDEVLQFSKEMLAMSDSFPVFVQQPKLLPLNVLCDTALFSRWIDLERKFAFEKIDDMMLKEGSWSFGFLTSREDDHEANDESCNEVSKCVETFVALLQTMTNRYKILGSDHVQLQLKFVDLQCELLEDMRMRFAQILRQEFPMSEKFCLILNSSQFLIDILNSWSEQPLFLKLYYEKDKNQDKNTLVMVEYEDPSLFREIINGFDFVVKDLVKSLGDHISDEVKSRSRPYRKEIRWYSYSLPQVDSVDKLDPSPECFGMFQVLSSSLEHIGKILSRKLLGAVSRHVSDKMDEFFICDVILENKFNSDGCQQITVDINKGLRAIFNNQINSSFEQIKPLKYEQLPQVCKLLLMKPATAILLHDSIKQAEENEKRSKISILDEFKLDALTVEQTFKILERRIDLQ